MSLRSGALPRRIVQVVRLPMYPRRVIDTVSFVPEAHTRSNAPTRVTVFLRVVAVQVLRGQSPEQRLRNELAFGFPRPMPREGDNRWLEQTDRPAQDAALEGERLT